MTRMKGTGLWHAEHAWVGHVATNVLIEVADGIIKAVTQDVPAPDGAVRLPGFTFPGLANVHSHAFQESLRGRTESGGGDFWEWRRMMFDAAQGWDRPSYTDYARSVFREMLHAGITAVGEFHYLHRYGNELGEALIDAARAEGIRITLLDACYLRGGLDGRPLEGVQRSFSDGDAERWVARVDELREGDGVRIGAAIHSVRAVDRASMRVVAAWARRRKAPLHMHLAEQPAEVDECIEFEGCTPAELLESEGILGPDLTTIHAIHVSESDVELLGSHKVRICASPTTERDLGDRVGPLPGLAEAGSPLCLGSDSNSVIDILEEARALELDQRRAIGKRVIHSPEALLEAATVGGMRSLGWDAGELKPGMLADFATVAPPRTEWRGLGLGYLIFCCSARDVKHVVVGGRTVVGH
jgi:formiminoglutamate deiminase